MLLLLPLKQLSAQMTRLLGSLSRRSMRWEPIKPQPPVTRMRVCLRLMLPSLSTTRWMCSLLIFSSSSL